MYVGFLGHDAELLATTDVDGKYTASLRRADRGYTLFVSPDTETGLATADYGDVPCGYATPMINVQRHVAGIDVRLSKGHWITIGAKASTGASVRAQVTLAVYLPQYGRWCDATEPDRSILEPPDYLFRRVFYPAGTYRVRATTDDGLYPQTWYPSALTGASATAIVLDRDLVGADAKVVTLPSRVYGVSGRVALGGDAGVPFIQVVTQDVGRIEVVNEGYPQDLNAGTYTFRVAPGSYRIRASSTGAAPFYYHPNAVTNFDAGTPVVVTNADRSRIDILK